MTKHYSSPYSFTFGWLMHSFFIPYKNAQIHYLLMGKGEKLLLCLHGFGETAESFEVFEGHLSERYTVIAIDLPLHGQTKWNEPLPFTITELTDIITAIPDISNRSFSVMGYSMGGRIALQLYQHIPQRIEKLILIAPDGLIINMWYRIATQTDWGNILFRRAMKNPAGFFALTKALKKLSLINTGVYNYVHLYLKNEHMRLRLYNIWTTMRKMKPDIPFVQSLIQNNETPVILIYGQYDKVIRFTTGEKFKKKVEDFCTLHILPTGHRLLHEKNSATIASLL